MAALFSFRLSAAAVTSPRPWPASFHSSPSPADHSSSTTTTTSSSSSSWLIFAYRFKPRGSSPIRAMEVDTTATNAGATPKELPARERRQLRNRMRESKAYDWKSEIEEKISVRKKKPQISWMEELNLDNLAHLGPQWWILRVSSLKGQVFLEQLAKTIATEYPNIEFQIYFPAVNMKNKLKSGKISVRGKSIFPGNVFLRCVLNKELHDFIKESTGVYGFVSAKVGSSKLQINKPKHVNAEEMEAVFQQVKNEQEAADLAFEKEHVVKDTIDDGGDIQSSANKTPRSRSGRGSVSSCSAKLSTKGLSSRRKKRLVPGSSIRVLSGPFAGFTGCLKKVSAENGMASMAVSFFGKESLVDVSINEIEVVPLD